MLTVCSKKRSQVMTYPRNGGVYSKMEKMDGQWKGLGILELYGPSVFREDSLCGLCVLYMETTGHMGYVLRTEILRS